MGNAGSLVPRARGQVEKHFADRILVEMVADDGRRQLKDNLNVRAAVCAFRTRKH
jgi:hypothetical protein